MQRKIKLPEGVNKVHLIGIGGIGMSAIAKILNSLKCSVQGSEAKRSHLTQDMENDGIKVFYEHVASNITGVDLVVRSTAIIDQNPEVLAAKSAGIPVISRADMLAMIVKNYYSIAVSGTHGKTTTTALIGNMLVEAGQTPLIVNGGIMNGFASNVVQGGGDIAVFEADESDGSFLKTAAQIKVVTNIDKEHLDYHGGFDNLKAAYKEFIVSVPSDGFAVLCHDNENLKEISCSLNNANIISYGIGEGEFDLSASSINVLETGSVFDVSLSERFSKMCSMKAGVMISDLKLSMLGEHNVQNCLAVIAAGLILKIPIEIIRKAIASFKGVQRRFTEVADLSGLKIIDDYAHHPEEIQATLKLARKIADIRGGRLYVIFQPHKYSRLRALFDEFLISFDYADHVLISDVYSAGEPYDEIFNTKKLIESLKIRLETRVEYLDKHENLPYIIERLCSYGDLVVFLGAGDITSWARSLPAKLSSL